jgi:hypothetical protein
MNGYLASTGNFDQIVVHATCVIKTVSQSQIFIVLYRYDGYSTSMHTQVKHFRAYYGIFFRFLIV